MPDNETMQYSSFGKVLANKYTSMKTYCGEMFPQGAAKMYFTEDIYVVSVLSVRPNSNTCR